MKQKQIVIVGGGTAGWMTAAYLLKLFGKDNSITVIESPGIPKIGVGESVTPHVTSFFDDIGVPRHVWMKHTGAVYKYANKFINWKTGNGETEYFSFNYTVPANRFLKDITAATKVFDFAKTGERSTDYALDLCKQGVFSRFDQCFNPQFHYMEKNVAPFDDNNELLLNGPSSFAQHINAELAGNFIRDHIAIPGGVKHILATVTDVQHQDNIISEITLDNGTAITGDLFIDCSGFHRVLIDKLGWEYKKYTDHLIDRAWVCQTDYVDPETEMVNYTQSIAEPHGWRFKIGLYHRMGNGYCYSSSHISDDEALEHFIKQIGPQRIKPKLIKWEPTRLKTFAAGNVAAVGLTCGFIEPLEANALYTIITSLRLMADSLKTTTVDWTYFNNKMGYTIDDIADFILVHYTMSSRRDTKFWRDMADRGNELNHRKTIVDKYNESKNSMYSAITHYTMFPDYMWAQMSYSWGEPIATESEKNNLVAELARNHFQHIEQKHQIISSTRKNNFHWLKESVFDNLTPAQWEQQYIKNSIQEK